MAYSAENFIPITARISPAGLSFANFATAMIIADPSESSASVGDDAYKTYSRIQDVAEDYPITTEVYKLASIWLGGTPRLPRVMVWNPASGSTATLTETLNAARNKVWWFVTLLGNAALADNAKVEEAAQWCEANGSFLPNSQTGTGAADIRNQMKDDDISSLLTQRGFRMVATGANADDPYCMVHLAKWFAKVNYLAANSTITGEFKISSGLKAEDVDGSAVAAMEAKKCAFYPIVDLQGSQVFGRWTNTITHSSYGEYIDDVFNLAAFINTLTVRLFNALQGATTKLPQTPEGMQVLISVAKQVGDQYVRNRYLGARNFVDPDDGIEKFTFGYEVLTKAEDILDITPEERNGRLAAPIRMRLFRAGAIHKAPVELDIY